MVTGINHPSLVSNLFLPLFQWHVKPKAVRWPSTYTGETLLGPLLEAFLPCKSNLQTAELRAVEMGCKGYVRACLDVTVRGNIPTATPGFPDLIFGPWKKVHHVFGCSFKAHIVSCKVGRSSASQHVVLLQAPQLSGDENQWLKNLPTPGSVLGVVG